MAVAGHALKTRVLPILLAVSVLVLLGCSGGGRGFVGSHGAPKTLKDCGEAVDPGPDGGVAAGMLWPAGKWPLHSPAEAYVCMGSFAGSELTVTSSGGSLTVQPARFTVPAKGGVLPVSITANARGNSLLQFQVVDRVGRRELRRTVATVVADDEQWHFQRPG